MSRSSFFQNRFWNVFDNLMANVILSVLIAAAPVILGIILKSQATYLILLLVFQCFIIGLLLLNRKHLSGQTLLRLRADLLPLPRRAPDVKDILLVGRTLGVVLRNVEFFKERLRNGATLRLVMADFLSNETLCQVMGTFPETLKSDMQTSLKVVKDIAKAARSPGQLEVRLIDFVPSLSLAAVDGQLSTGHIVVELVPYQISSSTRPHLLYRAREAPWFDYFRAIAERIWQDASPLDIKQHLEGS